MNPLPRSFYLRDDVVLIASELIGKSIVTVSDGAVTSGIISETEAYNGIIDKASHAYGGRRTTRTEIMYRQGGTAYIYLCYGIHSLFNVVTNVEGIPHAVLIRGIIPLEGKDLMALRANKNPDDRKMGSGPGNVAKILGLHYSDTGRDLCSPGSGIWIEDNGFTADPEKIIITPRIGVDYAGDDALLPYRFLYRE